MTKPKMCIRDRGYGPYQIASKLKEEKILIPSAYLAQHGEGVNKNKTIKDCLLYTSEGILHHPEGVDLVPSNIELSGMEVALVNAMSRETCLLYTSQMPFRQPQ